MGAKGLPSTFQDRLADRYLVERMIGAGGMATVWLARDIKLRRSVAIKVLRPDVSASLSKERFLNEIRISAHLQHPHILTLIESGEEAGLLYFIMPFVDGETLQQRLQRTRQLPIESALAIAADVGNALDHAHRYGIVHRDIKPSNLLLHEGGVFVTDFGIATAHAFLVGDRLTDKRRAIGTLQYMSPEQALGDAIDARSDIYSLACTVYEMLAGEPPFTASDPRVLVAQILTAVPPPLSQLRPGIPRHIVAAVARGLAKAPDDRFASVAGFGVALEQPHGSPSTRPTWGALRKSLAETPGRLRRSIASRMKAPARLVVLPFLDISDGGNAYIGRGIAEEVLSAVWRAHRVRVISRTSAFHYEGSGKEVREIARELGATHVVEGSVQTRTDEYQISVRLVDGRRGEILAEAGFVVQRAEDHLIRVQDQVADWVVENIGRKVEPRPSTGRPRPLQAELQFYRGRDAWNQRTPRGFREAREALTECLRLDPRHAKGHAAMADLFNLLGAFDYALLAPSEAYPQALFYARKAIDLDPDLAEGHAALANALLSYEWDAAQAANELRQAIELNPDYAPARQWYSTVLMLEGRAEEAEAEARRVLKSDPKSPYIPANIGRILQFRRRFDEAARAFQDASAKDERFVPAYLGLAVSRVQMGQAGAALESLAEARSRAGQNFPLLTSLEAYVFARMGRTDEARSAGRALEKLYEQHPLNRRRDGTLPSRVASREDAGAYVSAEFLALVHLGLDETELAIQWLEQARANRSQIVSFVGIEPMFDPLRGDPRFQEMAACLHRRRKVSGVI